MASDESSGDNFSSGDALSHTSEKKKNKKKNKKKKYDQYKRDTSSLSSSHSSYISNASRVRDERRKKKKYKEKKRSYHNRNRDDNYIHSDNDYDDDDNHYVKKKKHKKDKYKSPSCSYSSDNSSEGEKKKRKHKKEKKRKEKDNKRDTKIFDDEIKNNKENNLTVKELKKERENLMRQHFNYTDECNPFGDNTLSTPFVWKLKNKYEKIKNQKKIKLTTNSLLENCVSKINEIEQVKKRREDREKERQMIEDHRLQLEKQKNQINIKEYMEKEHLFFFNQEIHFSNNRIKHKDIQPIDIFRTSIQILKGEEHIQKSVDINNYTMPFNKILEGLREKELINCERQIKLFQMHDKMFDEEKYENFWNALLFFCKYYLDKIQLKEEENNNIDDNTDNKIESFFLNKTYNELITYEDKIKKKILMEESTDKDMNYWNRILFKIPYYKSKYILKCFQEKLKKKLNKIDNTNEHHDRGQIKTSEKKISVVEEKQESLPYKCESPILYDIKYFEKNKYEIENVYNSEEELKERKKIYENILIKLKGMEEEQEEEQEEDLSILSFIKGDNNKEMERNNKVDIMNDNDRYSHLECVTEDFKNKDNLNNLFKEDKKIFDSFVQREKKKGIKDEIIMKDIPHHIIKTATLLKDSLFVARKPLYFNRIKTSFDWNKYNKTHYDYENTPPKYICGYKFNIFYTNLINKNHKPTWKLYPSNDGDDTKVIIIFHGGIPYLDIAFKIINAEWSLDKNKGFRNIFDRGILQLYFNFKKKRYRR
ncbi:cactin-like protein [Plasmodium gaboni]|uniref:Splicing factor Cactin n=1 Tax=Plasmodium gaboni TaxID=647221 RepID=A0A151LN37_9APIC|nr:cactin-like protein [Plasmodium gaboni]KYO00643.1 cactin-like protein [Plasmodium gaboni]